jgi:integrase
MVQRLAPQLSKQTASHYLQALLLTGARPGELLALHWEDVNEKWKGLTIRDKVEGERTIPQTPYVAELLGGGRSLRPGLSRRSWGTSRVRRRRSITR